MLEYKSFLLHFLFVFKGIVECIGDIINFTVFSSNFEDILEMILDIRS